MSRNQREKVRQFMEELLAKMVDGPLDDVSVGQLSSDENCKLTCIRRDLGLFVAWNLFPFAMTKQFAISGLETAVRNVGFIIQTSKLRKVLQLAHPLPIKSRNFYLSKKPFKTDSIRIACSTNKPNRSAH